jgi:hypothetical protein
MVSPLATTELPRTEIERITTGVDFRAAMLMEVAEMAVTLNSYCVVDDGPRRVISGTGAALKRPAGIAIVSKPLASVTPSPAHAGVSGTAGMW